MAAEHSHAIGVQCKLRVACCDKADAALGALALLQKQIDDYTRPVSQSNAGEPAMVFGGSCLPLFPVACLL